MHRAEIRHLARDRLAIRFTKVMCGAYLHAHKCAPFSISRKLEDDLQKGDEEELQNENNILSDGSYELRISFQTAP